MLRALAITLALLHLLVPGALAQSDYGVIFSSLKDDRVFNSLVVSAIKGFEQTSDIRVRQRVINTADDSSQAIRAFADRGVTTIILVGFIHEAALQQLAPHYPNARFTLIDGRVEAANVRSILFREHEAGYLVGMAAGYASQTGKVAFIGGTAIPPVQRFGCGFQQGLRSLSRPVEMLTRYLAPDAEGFRDRWKARIVTESVMVAGVDVVFPAAGVASRDVLLTAANAGRLGIGVDSDQHELAPDHILTSALKRVDVAVKTALNDLHQWKWTAGYVELGVAEGGIDWSQTGIARHLSADLVARIEKAKADIIAGRIQVTPTAPGCDAPQVALNPAP